MADLTRSCELSESGTLVVRSVVTFQQLITATCRCINLMQAASLSATRTVIMRQSATNLCGQSTDVLRIPSGVKEVQDTTTSESR